MCDRENKFVPEVVFIKEKEDGNGTIIPIAMPCYKNPQVSLLNLETWLKM